MKSVLTSIQPYWVFLIIARIMGWTIPQEKTVEVRKDFPKDKAWNRKVAIYCTKSRRSFKRIPAQYQPFMKKLLGKVVGEFVCDQIENIDYTVGIGGDECLIICGGIVDTTCLTGRELYDYSKGKPLYGWHISDLKLYDKPKRLGEFSYPCLSDGDCFRCKHFDYFLDPVTEGYCTKKERDFDRPPQSWCYVEGI